MGKLPASIEFIAFLEETFPARRKVFFHKLKFTGGYCRSALSLLRRHCRAEFLLRHCVAFYCIEYYEKMLNKQRQPKINEVKIAVVDTEVEELKSSTTTQQQLEADDALPTVVLILLVICAAMMLILTLLVFATTRYRCRHSGKDDQDVTLCDCGGKYRLRRQQKERPTTKHHTLDVSIVNGSCSSPHDGGIS